MLITRCWGTTTLTIAKVHCIGDGGHGQVNFPETLYLVYLPPEVIGYMARSWKLFACNLNSESWKRLAKGSLSSSHRQAFWTIQIGVLYFFPMDQQFRCLSFDLHTLFPIILIQVSTKVEARVGGTNALTKIPIGPLCSESSTVVEVPTFSKSPCLNTKNK